MWGSAFETRFGPALSAQEPGAEGRSPDKQVSASKGVSARHVGLGKLARQDFLPAFVRTRSQSISATRYRVGRRTSGRGWRQGHCGPICSCLGDHMLPAHRSQLLAEPPQEERVAAELAGPTLAGGEPSGPGAGARLSRWSCSHIEARNIPAHGSPFWDRRVPLAGDGEPAVLQGGA